MLPFACLLSVLTGLAFWGAGSLPGALPVAAGVLAAGLGGEWWRTRRARPLAAPADRWQRRLLWTGLVACLFIGLTAVPLPNWAWLHGSRRWTQNQQAATGVKWAADIGLVSPGLVPTTFALTRNRAGTLRMLLHVGCCFLVLALVWQVDDRWAGRVAGAVVLLAAAVTLGGMIAQWGPDLTAGLVPPPGKRIWWLFTVDFGRPVGSFINRNHYGAFAGLCCPLALALAATALAARRWGSLLGWLAVVGVLSLGAVTSLSRSAWLAYVAGLVVAGLVLGRRHRTEVGIAVSVVLVLVFMIIALGSSGAVAARLQTLSRPLQTESAQSRLHIWSDGLRIWRDYPLIGIGAEAFRTVYDQYKTTGTRKTFFHAENEYLQLLIEGGLVGLGLAGLAVFLGLRAALARWWGSADDPGALTGGLGALAVAGVHAALEFAPRIPLFALTLAVLLGLMLRPARGARRDAPPGPGPGKKDWPIEALGAVGALFLVILVYIPQGARPDQMDRGPFVPVAQNDELAVMLRWAPTKWDPWFETGRRIWTRYQWQGIVTARRFLEQAAAYAPDSYEVWRVMVEVRELLGDGDGAEAARDEVRRLRPDLLPPNPGRESH